MLASFAVRRHISLKKLYAALWALTFLGAGLLSWLIPPMQSPDELSHINRACMISQGDLLLQTLPADLLTGPRENNEATAFIERARRHGGRIGGLVDQGLLSFIGVNSVLVQQADKRLSAAEKSQLAQMKWTGIQHYHILPGTGYYFPAIYAPQALGLAIGQRLNLSIEHSYQIVRGLTLLACFAMLWLAFRLMAPNPLVAAILLLPMSVFQLLSPTIDGVTMSLSVLAVSLFLKSADPGRKHSPASSWGLALCIFLLATSRTHLLPLLVLPFYLAWQRQSRRDFYLGCLVIVGALGWVLFSLYSTNDPRIVRSQTTPDLLALYATHPLAFFKVVFASLTDPDLFTFYQQSFIGILGWLDARLPGYFYPALWTGLALCALVSVSVSTLRQDWRARLLLAGLALASMGLIFLALLVTWTPHPASVVQGVQGRYFVVPMLLLGYAASGFATVQPPLRRWLAGLVLAGFALSSLTALTMTLFSRYH